jgi:hypothetical protein
MMGEAKRKAAAIQTGTVAGCGNCRFYLDDPMVKGGICRYNPPVPVMLGLKKNDSGEVYPEVGTCWPEVARGRWCGRHEPTVTVPLGEVDFSRLDLAEGSA